MMEATTVNAFAGFSYPLRTPVQAAITRGCWLLSSVLGARRDSLHTNADHPGKLLDAGVQVADPRYRSSTRLARIHVH